MAARAGETTSDMTSIKSAEAITPASGNVVLTRISRGLYVGVTGNVSVVFAGDNATTLLVGLAAGVWHPMQVQEVKQSGTTATSVVVGY